VVTLGIHLAKDRSLSISIKEAIHGNDPSFDPGVQLVTLHRYCHLSQKQ
jgi:hypothetical protein